ncbi:hypothetical protein ACHAXT_009488 [Thalassiosira profunda]
MVPLINCTELAQLAFGLDESWATVNASHPWVNHMAWNYRQYYKSMPPGKELIVMRSESLWDDWVSINEMMSREHDPKNSWPKVPPFREIHRNVSSEYRKKEKWKIHAHEEQMWLCQLLHEEIRTYLTIVHRAVNLDESDLLEAAAGVDKMCR